MHDLLHEDMDGDGVIDAIHEVPPNTPTPNPNPTPSPEPNPSPNPIPNPTLTLTLTLTRCSQKLGPDGPTCRPP